MKQKLITYFLLSVFIFSTIGIPVNLHYCQMMQEKSFSGCEICKAEMERNESSCCAEETMEFSITISSDNPICCQDEFVYNKVEDEYVTTKSDVNFFSSSENLFQAITIISPSIYFSLQESIYCDSSPPFLIDPEINITNSVLLI